MRAERPSEPPRADASRRIVAEREPPRRRTSCEGGQASLELLAGIPLLLLTGLVCLQLLAVGYSSTLVDGATEAGAIAQAAGAEAEQAAREALPEWARRRSQIEVEDGRVTVRLEPPAAIPGLARALVVASSAWVRRAP